MTRGWPLAARRMKEATQVYNYVKAAVRKHARSQAGGGSIGAAFQKASAKPTRSGSRRHHLISPASLSANPLSGHSGRGFASMLVKKRQILVNLL